MYKVHLVSVFCALAFIAACSQVESVKIMEEDSVLILNQANFKAARKQYPILFIDFYAQWCGFCQKLAPELAKAARAMRKEEPNLRIGMVDASEETLLADRYKIEAFPTLILFKGDTDEVVLHYNGGGTASNIMNWLRTRMDSPSSMLNTLAQVKKAEEETKDVLFIGFFQDLESAESKAFENSAYFFDGVEFARTNDSESMKAYEITEPAGLMAIRKFDEGNVRLGADTKMNITSIKKFITENRLPIINEYTKEFGKIFTSEKNMKFIFLFHGKRTDIEPAKNVFKAVAEKYKGQIRAVTFNMADNQQLGEELGIGTEEALPCYLVMDYVSGELAKYKPETNIIDEESVGSFVKAVVTGRVLRHYNSEPFSKDWDKLPVNVLVGTNFAKVAYNTKKTVFVEFYAPWCGFCTKMEPIYDELGEAYKDNDNVVIAKINAVANEVEGINIPSFPTFKLFPKGSSQIIDYKGGKSVDAFKAFIDSNGKKGAGEERSDL